MTSEPTEPHVNVFRFGSCVACGAEGTWYVIAVPELATGLQHPMYGVCDACEHRVDLKDDPPFKVEGDRMTDMIPVNDPSEIPQFASEDEEVAFWDTHEITDELWAKLEPAAGDEPLKDD